MAGVARVRDRPSREGVVERAGRIERNCGFGGDLDCCRGTGGGVDVVDMRIVTRTKEDLQLSTKRGVAKLRQPVCAPK